MTSFFEKLKKGMRVQNNSQDLELEEEKPIKETIGKKKIKKQKKEEKEEIETAKVKNIKEKKLEGEDVFVPKKKEEMKKIEIIGEEKEVEKKPIEIKEEKKWFEPEGQLTIDVYQTNGEVVIQSAVAGVRPEELDISIENDVLLVKGERKQSFEKEEKNYFYQECYWGRFSREVILPVEVDPSRTEAIMQNGVLTIRIPKIEREKKRKVVVKE